VSSHGHARLHGGVEATRLPNGVKSIVNRRVDGPRRRVRVRCGCARPLGGFHLPLVKHTVFLLGFTVDEVDPLKINVLLVCGLFRRTRGFITSNTGGPPSIHLYKIIFSPIE
jgi:hypothetical protein